MERFPHGPLGMHWHREHIRRIAEAAARFQAETRSHEVTEGPRIEEWEALVRESIAAVRINQLPDAKRWSAGLKQLSSRLDEIVEEWRARDTRQWVHGDLHLANAMSRDGLEKGPVALIDLAEVHAGSWIEDAVYLERQLWSRPERLKPHGPVKTLAAERRRLGLPVEKNYARLAMIRRLLLAATAPRFLRSEGHPAHLDACANWLDRGLAEVK
jgi:Ser/Thr protein kinase RdoA (MazF antagonist)